MYSLGYACAFICGILIAVILCVIFLKMSNTDNDPMTKYDERQQIVRGIGYKYSFWTLVLLIAGLIVLDACGIVLPIENTVLYFLIMVIAMMVHTTYCIFNDGYFGINNKPKQYYIFFVFIGLFNVFIGILNSIERGLISDGKLSTPVINLICGLLFVELGICIVIKKKMTKNEDYDEEDDEEE